MLAFLFVPYTPRTVSRSLSYPVGLPLCFTYLAPHVDYMLTKPLTEEEYLETMSEEMVDVTEVAEAAVDIWPYVEKLVRQGVVLQQVVDDTDIEMVYRNTENDFDHVLLRTEDESIFTVIVVDTMEREIVGHFVLNLGGEG